MNILMLTDKLGIGGAETHIRSLCRELMRRGHRITVAAASGPTADALVRDGAAFFPLSFRRDPFSLLITGRRLYQMLREGAFDLVHCHARLPATLATPLCRRVGVPLVTTAHWVFRAAGWRRRFSRWGEMTFAVSEDIRRYLSLSYGLEGDRIRLIPNGVDTSCFYPPDAPQNPRKILHVSRLDHGRAATAAALIRIAPALAAVADSLTIVGDGDRFPVLYEAALAANAKIGRTFLHMLGARQEVAPLLRECGIFVGVSRAALEAMACGCATVLAGDEGYLSVAEGDILSLAAEGNFCCRGSSPLSDKALLHDLTVLLSDPERAARAGREACDFVASRYTAGHMADAAEAGYRVLCPEKSAGLSVVLCGYYGFDNLGDDACLLALTERLYRAGCRPITLLAHRPKEAGVRFGLRAVSRTDPASVDQALLSSDIFWLGGGNLLQDRTSRRSLLYYTQLARHAKRTGCRLVIQGGIGPLRTKRAEKRAGAVLAAAELCLFRTPADMARAVALVPEVRARSFLLPDDGLSVPPATAARMRLTGMSLSPGKRYLAVCLRGANGEPILQRMAALCEDLAARYQLTPLFLPMHREQDLPDAQRLAAMALGEAAPPLSPSETVAVFENAALLVTQRLHALIFATAAGIPVISFAEDEKIRDFAAFRKACAPSGGEEDGLDHPPAKAYAGADTQSSHDEAGDSRRGCSGGDRTDGMPTQNGHAPEQEYAAADGTAAVYRAQICSDADKQGPCTISERRDAGAVFPGRADAGLILLSDLYLSLHDGRLAAAADFLLSQPPPRAELLAICARLRAAGDGESEFSAWIDKMSQKK